MFPLGEHSKWRCETPPQKGYLGDTCTIPFENKAKFMRYPPLRYYLERVYCAIWGVSRTGLLRPYVNRSPFITIFALMLHSLPLSMTEASGGSTEGAATSLQLRRSAPDPFCKASKWSLLSLRLATPSRPLREASLDSKTFQGRKKYQKRPFVHNSVCSQFLEGLFAILAQCSQFCLRSF